MKKDKDVTEVQFRKLSDGDVIAVFPYQIEGLNYVCSYTRVGQHSVCWWDINQGTTAAKPSEYKDLLKELKSIGYNIKVIKRRNHSKYLKELYKEKLRRIDIQMTPKY